MAQLRLETRLSDSRLSPHIYFEHLIRAGHFAGLQIHFTGLIPPPTLPGRFSNPIVMVSRQDSPSPASPTLLPPGSGLVGGCLIAGTRAPGPRATWLPILAAPAPSPDRASPRPPGRSLTCRGPCRASAGRVVPEGAKAGEPLAAPDVSARRPR